MHTLEGLPISAHYRQLLFSGSRESAAVVLHEFFDYYSAGAAEESLWFILTAALKYDGEEVTALHRADMLFFYECCTAFFKAIYMLHGDVAEQ